jgi:hypothetical protein
VPTGARLASYPTPPAPHPRALSPLA